MEVEPMHVPPKNILNDELETLIIASIETLEHSNKKYGKNEVFQLVKYLLEKIFQGKLSKIFYTG